MSSPSTGERVQAAVLRLAMNLPPALQRRLVGPPVVREGQRLQPETQMMLTLQRVSGEPKVEEQPLEEARPLLVRQARAVGGHQPVGRVDALRVGGGAGDLDARLYVPRALLGDRRPSGLLVFFHGGGFLYGDLDSHDAPCRFLAEQAGVRVLSVDYRLSPEHPYPAPHDDAVTSYLWAVQHAEELGVDPARIGVGGDSAGGNLAASVALTVAEAGVRCALQLLVYPMTDARAQAPSRRTYAEGFYLSARFMDNAEEALLTDPAQREDPRLSMVLRRDVPALTAPAFVVTAGFDPLRDEGEEYAALLAAHGTPVTHVRHEGLIHGFFNVVGCGQASRAANLQIAEQVRAALG
ncbi:alpha/beta hydrolase [Marmoricola endophyticus]|uniref:alpha/beta hydrolase n=1 Tax=Marmoricola endophyticus TaxID=2040280 RepID=UPI001E2BBDC4|nr:alpha/beta hydrolase [Marmoricola endophyticus]